MPSRVQVQTVAVMVGGSLLLVFTVWYISRKTRTKRSLRSHASERRPVTKEASSTDNIIDSADGTHALMTARSDSDELSKGC